MYTIVAQNTSVSTVNSMLSYWQMTTVTGASDDTV